MEIEETSEVYENDETVFALPQNSQLDETFTDRLRVVFKWLSGHKKAQAMYLLAVKKILKIMTLTPELEPLTLYPDDCSKNLLDLFTALGRTVDDSFKINDFYSFCCYNERIMTFKTQRGHSGLNMLSFAALTSEFCRLIEHTQAFGVFQKLDAEVSASTKLPSYFEGVKFNGCSFSLYWKLKALLLRMADVIGVENVRQRLTQLNVMRQLEDLYEMRALRRLFASIPGYYENDKMMFYWVKEQSIFTSYVDEPTPEVKAFANNPLFNLEHIITAIEQKHVPDLRTYDNVPASLRQPSEKDINSVALLIAANAFKSPKFQEFIIAELDKSLRLNTTPPVNNSDRLTIYSKTYPLKRLTNVCLKKANNLLLYQLAKCQINDDFVITYQSHRDFKKFKESIVETFRHGYFVTEESLQSLSDDLRRLNRRYNKIFDKAFGCIADCVIRFYSGFYFEQAVRRHFVFKGVKAVSAIGKQLCTIPEWKSIRRNDTVSRDINVGVYPKMLAVIAEIEKSASGMRMKLSFWKGLKKYDEREFDIAKVSFPDNVFELATNVPLSSLINDFQPNVLVIVADCPEAYLLRPKINSCIHLATMEGKHGQIKEPMSVYFLRSQLLDSLTVSSVNWNRGQVYNCFLQNPLLTFLTLFRSDLSESQLFNPRKVDLKSDLCMFMLKISVLESIFEKGISFGDLLATRHAPQLLSLLGLTSSKEQLSELWKNKKAEAQIGMIKFNTSKCQAWYRFNKKNAPDASLVLFNLAPDSETGFTLIRNAVDSYSTEQVRNLKGAIDKVLKSSVSDIDSEKRLLANLLPNSDYLTNALNLRRVMVELRYTKHTKVSALSEMMKGDANELKTARKVFKKIIDLHKDVIVQMTVTSSDNTFVNGTVAGIFHASLHYNDIDFGVKISAQNSLEKYFSANEKINVMINKITPEILRLDVAFDNNFGLRMNRYLEESDKLHKYSVKRGVNFTIDPKTDFPLVASGVRTERNFDYFPTETDILKNWNLQEAKSRLRETKEDKFVFKPSQRGKSAYFDLLIYMSAIDTIFALPIEQTIYDETGTAKVNQTPKKYDQTDMNSLTFNANGHIFEGLKNLVSGFVKPLISALKLVIEHERYKTSTVDALIESLKRTDAITPQTEDNKPAFWITKSPVEELQFAIVYRDSVGNYGSKMIKVGPETFEFVSKFDKFEFMMTDFTENWKEERFKHQCEEVSNVKVVSIGDDSTSILSVSVVDETIFRDNGKKTAVGTGGGQRTRYHGQGSVAYGGGGVLESGDGGNWIGPRRQRTEHGSVNDRQQNRFGNNRNESNFTQNVTATAPVTTNAPSWGNTAAKTTETNVPSWGNAPAQSTTEATVPAWGNAPAQTSTEATVPTWGSTPAQTTTETAPSWGAAPAQPSTETPGWGNATETPKQGENAPNKSWNAQQTDSQQSAPRNNDFRPRGQGFGQRDGNSFQNRPPRFNNNNNNFQRGPRQFNNNNNTEGNNQQSQNQPSWGNNTAANNNPSWGAAPAQTDTQVPTWGAPAPEAKADTTVPSWGATATEVKTDSTVPSWGAPAPTTTDTKTTETSTWGAPAPTDQPVSSWGNNVAPKTENTGNSWNSSQNNNFNNRPPRDNNWNNRPQRDNNFNGERRNFGDRNNNFRNNNDGQRQPRFPPRDNNNSNTNNSWGNNNNAAQTNSVPAWGNNAETTAPAVPTWGAVPEQKAEPVTATWGAVSETTTTQPVASWGNTTNEQPKAAENVSGWGETEAPKVDSQTAAPNNNNSWGQNNTGSSNWNNNRNNSNNNNGGNWQQRNFNNNDRPQRNFNDRPPRNNNYGNDRPQNNNFNRGNFQDRNNNNFRGNNNNWNRNREESQNNNGSQNQTSSWGANTTPAQVNEAPSWGAPKSEEVVKTDTQIATWGTTTPTANNDAPVATWGAPEQQKTEAPEDGEIAKGEQTAKLPIPSNESSMPAEHSFGQDDKLIHRQRINSNQGGNNRERGNYERNDRPRYNQNDGGRGGWNGGNRNFGGDGRQQNRGNWNSGNNGNNNWGGNRDSGQRQNWNRGQQQSNPSNNWNTSPNEAPKTENTQWGSATPTQPPAPAWGSEPAPSWGTQPELPSLSKRESPDFPTTPNDNLSLSNPPKQVKDKLLTETQNEEQAKNEWQ